MKNLIKYLKPYIKESILGPLFKLTEATFELLVPLVVASIITDGIGKSNASYVFKMGGVSVLFARLPHSTLQPKQQWDSELQFAKKYLKIFRKELLQGLKNTEHLL